MDFCKPIFLTIVSRARGVNTDNEEVFSLYIDEQINCFQIA